MEESKVELSVKRTRPASEPSRTVIVTSFTGRFAVVLEQVGGDPAVSVPIAQVSPGEVAGAAIVGMLEGKRSVVPGLVPNVVALAGRFTPRCVLLPALRLFNAPQVADDAFDE